MSYIVYEINLDNLLRNLPQQVKLLFLEENPMSLLKDIANNFNLVENEVGELCEIVRKLIVKELTPEDFEKTVAEKLDEDNRPRAGEIAFALNDQILTKLLPALGLKAPVIMKPVAPVVPASAVSPSSLEAKTLNLKPASPPARVVPLKKILPIPPSSYPSSLEARTLKLEAPLSSPLEPRSSNLKPSPSPLAPSSLNLEAVPLSAEPIESLMKMTAGKVRERELEHRFARLPETLKEALRSVDSARKVVDIARRHGLHVDKIGELGAQTGLVIFGFTHPGEFLSRLKGKLNLSEDTAREIAGEINSEIFLKIREALKEVNGEAKTSHPETASSFPQPSKSQAPVNIPPSPSPEPAITNQNPLGTGGLKTSSPSLEAKTLKLEPSPDSSPLEPAPSRDEILREIENPSHLKPDTFTPSPLEDRSSNSSSLRLSESNDLKPSPPPTPTSKNLEPNPPSPRASEGQGLKLKAVPVSSPLEAKTLKLEPSPEDIVEQKLSSPTVAAKSEKQYSIDPYRESIE